MTGTLKKDSEHTLVRNYIREKYGLDIPKNLKPIALSKLLSFTKKYLVKDWHKFFESEQKHISDGVMLELVEIFLVDHTSFFRNQKQFDILKETVLPEISNFHSSEDQLDLRIWSAGCSSGEEPYSIVISLLQYFGSNYSQIRAGVLATDISQTSLNNAKIGMYENIKVGAEMKQLIKKYVQEVDEHNFKFHEYIRNEVVFRPFNLNLSSYPFKKKFHIIFCRNVLFYFVDENRDLIQSKLINNLSDNGFLFLGDAENFEFKKYGLSRIGNGVYKK